MDYQELLAGAVDFAIAILLGALVGVEREKRKAEEHAAGHVAGLRTFMLLALLGAAAGLLSRNTRALDPGGGAPHRRRLRRRRLFRHRANEPRRQGADHRGRGHRRVPARRVGHARLCEFAIGLGVVTAAVLAYKQPLHGFVDKLGWDDVYAGVRLLIATFIALPLLPNHAIDPWGALNPYSLWLLVILISSLSLVGYVLTRLARAGEGRGADRAGRGSRLVHGGHPVVRAGGKRQSAEHGSRLPAASCSPGRSCSRA